MGSRKSFKYIGRAIREIREKYQLTQAELAQEIDVCSQYVSNTERSLCSLPIPALRKIVHRYKGSEKLIHEAFSKDKIEEAEMDFEQVMRRPSRRSKQIEV